jgi:ribosomal protein S15P/S13E
MDLKDSKTRENKLRNMRKHIKRQPKDLLARVMYNKITNTKMYREDK